MQVSGAIFERIHSGLTSGIDGYKMSDGSTLTCTSQLFDLNSISIAALPILSIKNGAWTAKEFSQWQSLITWDLPAELKVAGPADGMGENMRLAMLDVLFAIALIRGIPYNKETGKITPYSKDTLRLANEDLIDFLADRSGPIVTSFRVRPEQTNNPFIIADINFRLEFIVNHSPEEALGYVHRFVIGIHQKNQLEDTFSLTVPSDDEVRAQGAFSEPETVLTHFGREIEGANPPIEPNKILAAGADPSNQVIGLSIDRTLALTDPEDYKLYAIATYLDGSVLDVSGGATWSTSDDNVADVDNDGNVSTVGAGSCTITASFNNATALCSVTVS